MAGVGNVAGDWQRRGSSFRIAKRKKKLLKRNMVLVGS